MYKMGIQEKATPVHLIIRDKVNKSKLKFPNWHEAHDHIRQVILGQIVEQLAELALQDDPSEWVEEIQTLRDLAENINYPKSEEELEAAVEEWQEYADEGTDFVIIEIV